MSALLRLTRPFRSLPSLSPSRPRSLPPSFFSRHQNPTQSRSNRTYTDIFPPSNERANMRILYALIGANVSIFGYAMYLKVAAKQGHIAPFRNFLQNMTLNVEDLRQGRWWILLTSTFTHLSIGHIFSNMFTVYFLGRFLAGAPMITPARYLTIAIGSGISGSAGYLVNRYTQTQKSGVRDTMRGLGFSGAVMGISTVAACLEPTAKVHLYGVVPVPLWALVAGYAVYDGYYLNDSTSQVGHAGHLGGLAFGLIYSFWKLRVLRF